MSNRIEFYKNRSIGERLSVALDFMKQNWKVLYKNILPGGLPLAIVMGYFLTQQLIGVETVLSTEVFRFFLFYALFMLVAFMNFVYLYSMTGAVLFLCERNRLTPSTGWNDLKDKFFRFAGETFLITLIVTVFIIVITGIAGGIIGFSIAAFAASNSGSLFLFSLFFILLMGAFIAFAPSFTILYFPAYFSGKTSIESIKIAFSLGFKNWGSLFTAILITGIVFAIVYLVFSMPFQMMMLFTMGQQASIISYILAVLSAVGTMVAYPIMIVIFAFQYFSIVEEEEGVSLQSQMSEFENL